MRAGLLVSVGLSLLAGCRGPMLFVDDTVARPGQAAQLSASVSYRPVLGMCREVTSAGVRFFVGESIGDDRVLRGGAQRFLDIVEPQDPTYLGDIERTVPEGNAVWTVESGGNCEGPLFAILANLERVYFPGAPRAHK